MGLKKQYKFIKKNKLIKLVDCQFSVKDLKIWKPHPEPYLFVSKTLNYSPIAIIMVVIHGQDINGAKKVGMKIGYIESYEKKLSFYYDKADYEAESCKELVLKIVS